MKLYRVINFNDPDLGTTQTWFGSRAEAAKNKAQQIRDGAIRDALTIEAEEVPTDKKGLVKWLNLNFSTNNG